MQQQSLIIQLRGEYRFDAGDQNHVWLNGEYLDAAPSLAIRSHSPDGFNWGYGGSGPAQLALAICLRLFGRHIAQNIYQDFKRRYIAALPQENFIRDIDISPFLPVVAQEVSCSAESFYYDLEPQVYEFFEQHYPDYGNLKELAWDGQKVTLNIDNEDIARHLAQHVGEGEIIPQPDGYWLFSAGFQIAEALRPYLSAVPMAADKPIDA